LEKTVISSLKKIDVSSWDDINLILDSFAERPVSGPDRAHSFRPFPRGIAFVTFNYGIDGVTIEIAKYAKSLEKLALSENETTAIHMVGGNFLSSSDTLLDPRWQRLELRRFDGWNKWDEGKWFGKLFYEEMPERSVASSEAAAEIWRQAIEHAETLGDYIRANEISLLIPVNINSNPGNMAAALSMVIVSESLRIGVLNSNHDFYWEGGAPPSRGSESGRPGVRDHFFKNHQNRSFFRVLERIFPWNGSGWYQININEQQSQRLIGQFGFDRERVVEVETSIDDAFFEPCSVEQKSLGRLKMACILSGGNRTIRPVPLDAFLSHVDSWMENQRPLIFGARDGLELDIVPRSALYLLQPTRIVTKKRIDRDWELIGRLLSFGPFRERFEQDRSRTLVLHITGPVPIEHREDLVRIANAYRRALDTVPRNVADRLFTAFSVGVESHPSFADHGFDKLNIDDIYKLSDLVLFPSETEGRGLPILEAGAAGIPVVCSRYRPEQTFSELVGEALDDDLKIRYTLFPRGEIGEETLMEVTDLLFNRERFSERLNHNRRVVAARFDSRMLRKTFDDLLHGSSLPQSGSITGSSTASLKSSTQSTTKKEAECAFVSSKTPISTAEHRSG